MYKQEPKFEPFTPGANIGLLKFGLGDELVINDGQHRCEGIAKALKDGAQSLRDDTLSVLLFPWESTDRVQQMFSDLNRFVQKTSKSLDVLYDKRDELAAATLAMMEKVPVFKELTEKEKVSLESKSTKLFTLAALYDANVELLKGKENNGIVANAALLERYWTAVATHMPDWSKVLKGQKLAIEMRQEKIVSHSTVLRALGGLGVDLLETDGWELQLAGLDRSTGRGRTRNGRIYASSPTRSSPTGRRVPLPRRSSRPSSACPDRRRGAHARERTDTR